jgi:hypothetical protein
LPRDLALFALEPAVDVAIGPDSPSGILLLRIWYPRFLALPGDLCIGIKSADVEHRSSPSTRRGLGPTLTQKLE